MRTHLEPADEFVYGMCGFQSGIFAHLKYTRGRGPGSH